MNFVQKMTRYKAWANAKTYEMLRSVPTEEIYKKRKSWFQSIVSTLTHSYVVDDIFRGHIQGKINKYTSKNLDHPPTLEDLQAMVEEMDAWWVGYADMLQKHQEDEIVNFTFVDGSKGAMTRQEMILHTVNHSTYHRGHVDDMLYSISIVPPTTDLPAFNPDAITPSTAQTLD